MVILGNLNLVNLALATLGASILGLVIAYIILKKKITNVYLEFDLLFWKSIIIQSLPFALTGLFSLINFKIDQVILSFMTTDAIVGWYSAAYKIIDMLAILPSILLTALYPVLSRYYQESKVLLKKSFHLALRAVIILCIPIVIGVFLLADKIIIILYGQDYLNSIGVLKILIFISLISFVNTPLFVTLNAIGKQKITMINTAFTALVNIVMNIILIPLWSLKGAALATIIAEITFFALSSYQLKKEGLPLGIINKALKPIIAGIIMGVVVLLLSNLSLFIIVPISAVIYFGILILLREFSKEDVGLIKKTMRWSSK